MASPRFPPKVTQNDSVDVRKQSRFRAAESHEDASVFASAVWNCLPSESQIDTDTVRNYTHSSQGWWVLCGSGAASFFCLERGVVDGMGWRGCDQGVQG